MLPRSNNYGYATTVAPGYRFYDCLTDLGLTGVYMRVAQAAIVICLFSITIWAQETQTTELTPDQGNPSDASQSGTSAPQPVPAPQPPPPPSPYSRAYELRKDIHKYASYATLPLFAAEYALGQSLPSEPGRSGSMRGLHAAVGTGLVGLFFLNTATGGWNLWQSRHETSHRTTRFIHSALMIASNAGFVATAASAPSHHNPSSFDHDRTVHRNLAIASISVGTAGYLLALFRRLD